MGHFLRMGSISQQTEDKWEPAGQRALWEVPAEGKREGKVVKLVPETHQKILVTN